MRVREIADVRNGPQGGFFKEEKLSLSLSRLENERPGWFT